LKKYLYLLTMFLSVIALPFSASAEGWVYNLAEGTRWGTSSCTTSYKYINFEITPTKYGYATAYLQKDTGGSWINVLPGEDLYSWPQILSAPASSSSTKYRVYISVGLNGAVSGKVRCYGSNTLPTSK
jgi:hypothetical protein